MNIKSLGANQTELHLPSGTCILFSYETPVAVYVPDNCILVTTKKWSRTTSKHINAWLQKHPNAKVQSKEQSVIETWVA